MKLITSAGPVTGKGSTMTFQVMHFRRIRKVKNFKARCRAALAAAREIRSGGICYNGRQKEGL